MLRILKTTILFFWICIGHAQERYLDDLFSKISVNTYTYSDTLQLDFYGAKKDTLKNRPLLILVHGGGFASGKRDNPLEKKFCKEMAIKGYAVASISYRLTRKGKSFGCDCPAKQKLRTFVEISADILQAVSFLSEQRNLFGIDTEKIILIGSSAGAEGVLNTAFMKHQEEYMTLLYEDLKFAGIVSFAGAVVDARYITPENAVPTLLFHGKEDNLVPFGSASHHYCPSDKSGYLLLDGSASIAQRLENLKISYQLMYDTKGNHDWANLAYRYTDEISEFIKKVVIDEQHIQSKIQIDSNE
ncbi:alpha/beta hydrolase [Maribacter sp. 2210JD10-5]|uniref:alpha/beta hydrolase n=1 Tax=Maribacter sp. 2210JD10-5 TaxID=3386272 RepID=UPI0039BD05F4